MALEIRSSGGFIYYRLEGRWKDGHGNYILMEYNQKDKVWFMTIWFTLILTGNTIVLLTKQSILGMIRRAGRRITIYISLLRMSCSYIVIRMGEHILLKDSWLGIMKNLLYYFK